MRLISEVSTSVLTNRQVRIGTPRLRAALTPLVVWVCVLGLPIDADGRASDPSPRLHPVTVAQACSPGHFTPPPNPPAGYVVYFDVKCADFHSELRASTLSHEYVRSSDEVVLVIVEADWETEFSVQVNEEEVAVARPSAFGQSIEAGSFAALRGLLQVGITPATGREAREDLQTFENLKGEVAAPKYLPELRAKLARNLDALRSNTARLTSLSTAVTALIGELNAYAASAECSPPGPTCNSVKSSGDYPTHEAQVPVVVASVRHYNRLHQRVGRLAGELPSLQTSTTFNNTRNEAYALVAELETLIKVVEKTGSDALDAGVKSELDSFLAIDPDLGKQIGPQLYPSAPPAGGPPNRRNLLSKVQTLAANYDQAVNALFDDKQLLQQAAMAAEDAVRELVDEFNGTYARHKASWNLRRIDVPLTPLPPQSRVTISVYGSPNPLRLNLTLPKDGGDVQADPGSRQPTSPGATPVTEPPEKGAFLGKFVFDVHEVYRYKFGGGAIVSNVDDSEFGLIQIPEPIMNEEGETEETLVNQIRQTRSQDWQVEPVFYMVFYPYEKDLNAHTYRGWKRFVPGAVSGFSVADPSRHFYLGLNFEPVAGFDINFGLHWAKVQSLLDGFEVNDTLPDGATLPVEESFSRGEFFGMGIDVSIFAKFLGGLFKGS